MELIEFLKSQYPATNEGIFQADIEGYWSNLSRDENMRMVEALGQMTAREAMLKYQPSIEDVIYSPKRQAGLEVLELRGDEVCIDYGCMWGALTVPLAKRTKFVLGVDQTLESLRFLKARLRDEGINNVALLRNDLKKMPEFAEPARVDVAIVNGVLEWIPEVGAIELKTYLGKYSAKNYSGNPGEQQETFLRRIHQNLRDKGKIYLAIENRFDYKMFLGIQDPHSNTMFTTLVPRKMANWISRAKLGRPYVTWIYSFNDIAKLLKKSGFSKVDLYMCSPDYRYPENIIPYDNSLENYQLTISRKNATGKKSLKRTAGRLAEYMAFKVLKAKFLAPSIIAVGHK